jgi:hypothetical protein
MPATITPSPGFEARKGHHLATTRRKVILAGIGLGGIAVSIVVAVIGLGQFSESSVRQSLQEASDSRVQLGSFERFYFPFPGCVLKQVTFIHNPARSKPLIATEKLTIRGSYSGIFSKRLSQITMEGLRVSIPPFGTGLTFHTTPSKITTDEIIANGATLEFALHDPNRPPLRFDIREASLKNVGWSGPLTYAVKVHNPEPPGEVVAKGKFGVWNRSDPGQTPLSGEYKFEQADLSVYEGIAGKLSSQGTFAGILAHVDISGTTDTPDFEVKSGGHPVQLKTEFSAYVDAIHGDTYLKQVNADFLKTHVVAEGSVAGSPNGTGKIALLELRAGNARIEDFLRLFTQAKRPSMSGSLSAHVQAQIPGGPQPFLRRIKLQGNFGIAAGAFSQPSTQEGVNKLSAGARGEKDTTDPETVLSDLQGQVRTQNGIAKLQDLSFGVPGAAARVDGTYDLMSHKIDLRGQMQVESKISNTESGGKALLLKMMEPFFKKIKKGEIVPIRISGTYDHPSYGLDLKDKKADRVSPPQPAK